MRKLIRRFLFLCDNKLSAFLIFVLLTGLFFMIHYQISAYDIYYQRVQVARDMELGEAVILQFPFRYYLDINIDLAEKAREYDDILRKQENIKNFQCIASFGYYATSKDNKITLELDYLSDTVQNGMGYKLSSGSWPDAPNEVVLNEDVKGYFEIGDEISIQVIQNSDDLGNPSARWLDVQLLVTGFVDRNAIVLDFSGTSTRPTIATYMKPFYESNSIVGPCIVDDYVAGMGIIYDAMDGQGSQIERNMTGNSFLIRPIRGVSAEQLKKELMKLNIGDAYTGEELINRYEEDNKEEERILFRGIVILSLLSASSLFSAVFLQVKKRKADMAILYMTGMTPFDSSTVFGLYYLVIVAAASFLGYGIYYSLYNEFVAIRNEQLLFVTMGILAVTLLLIAPFYLVARKMSPLDYFRKD